jgi:hypothetical protein
MASRKREDNMATKDSLEEIWLEGIWRVDFWGIRVVDPTVVLIIKPNIYDTDNT